MHMRWVTRAARILQNIKNYKVVTDTKKAFKTAFSPKYLVFTNVTISVCLSGTGDWLQQQYEIISGESEEWNSKRGALMAASGAGVGLVCHYWYIWLDSRFPGRVAAVIAKKLLLDQLICSPIIISIFFVSCALFEDVTLEELKTELRHKFWKLYAAEWIVWPPAQLINFYLLPTKYRVLYDSTISLGYDVFTSRVKHSKVHLLDSKADSIPQSSAVAKTS